MKIKAIKLKMTQIWRDDILIGVTPVKVVSTGDEFGALKAGDLVKVRGVTKGKGFQGVVKRYGFGGGPKTHGQKNRHRAPGSAGPTAPQRTIPGRRMPGHMGSANRTIKNLEVVNIDPEQKIFLLRGSVPGNIGTQVVIRK